MSENKRKTSGPVIGITMGDPSGIGPEIILKSFENKSVRKSRIVVIGDFNIMHSAFNILNINSFKLNRVKIIDNCNYNKDILNILDLDLIKGKLQPGKVNTASGSAAFECLRKAIELAKKKEIDAIATAPLNKEALHLAGHKYAGHTEILADLTGTKDYAMLLYDKKLSVIHVSTHISLLKAVTGLKRERIEKVTELADMAMKRLLGKVPRIAIAGLNPHAGENGLFGDEEIREITPAVNNLKAKGLLVEGPVPPDTVFLKAMNGNYDVVVAMYHDQGHIPLKLLGFSTGVNITVGLPFIRTSVDHGTAFEIAWQGKASEKSMVEAIKLAIMLA
ncbi:MAG TPA: 4-hydroxythreonine-4-phosphate dehydrogenase PdxA [Bacteroidales bacterium]|nr:4-hydroxythreonine-4-phosphate dehydrogenase PdxA [Bacteroidales bacterium]